MSRRYVPYGERLLKRSSAARILGVSGTVVAAMAERGELAFRRTPSGQKVYRTADVLALREMRDALEAPAPAAEDASPEDDLASVPVAEKAEISFRRLDWWVRRGYLKPEGGNGTGDPRSWPPAEVEVACKMGRLVHVGLSVESAARAARQDGPEIDLGRGVRLVIADG